MSKAELMRCQEGPQSDFINMWDDIPLVFYGGESCASLLSDK